MIRKAIQPAIRPAFRSPFAAPYNDDLRAQVIAALFGAGQQGALYDPSDLSTLFQDSVETTPVTASSDPIRRVRDLSGNDNHLTSSTDAARPTYRVVGSQHVIRGLDITTNLQTANGAALGAATSGHVVAIAVIDIDPNTNRTLFNHNAGKQALQTPGSGSLRSNAFPVGSSSQANSASSTIAAGTAYVICSCANRAANLNTVRVNGSVVASTAIPAGDMDYAPAGLIGFPIGPAGGGKQMDVVAAAILGHDPTTEQLELLERWLASKAGITL